MYGSRMFFCTIAGFAMVAASRAQTFTNLVTFNGTDGANPRAALIEGSDGSLYGTTSGSRDRGHPFADGNVFKLTLSGTLSTVRSLGSDQSLGSLVQTPDGSLWNDIRWSICTVWNR